MLSPFRLLRPTTIEETTSELARLGNQAKVYAGGVELLMQIRDGLVQADHLVDVKRIPSLQNVSWDGDQLSVGAGITHQRLATHPLVRTHLPAFASVESVLANVRVRNQGTVGGNLCFNKHADSATALLIYDTTVNIAGKVEERQVSLEQFLMEIDQPGLAPDEVVTELLVPALPTGWRAGYERIERFPRPTINVAVAAYWRSERLEGVRLAIGCIGPRARRLRDLEHRLLGLTLADAQRVIGESKPELAEVLQPVNDPYGSRSYKLQITAVFLQRALSQTAGGVGGHHDG